MMNNEQKPFLRPVLRGPRFETHGVPVDVLEELRLYRDFVVDVAKTLYLKANPERKRVPKGFVDGFQLLLKDIEEGSAAPVLNRELQMDGDTSVLLFPAPLEEDYFEVARDLIMKVVEAVQNDQDVPESFPAEHLNYFKRFGKTLRPDEAMQLVRPGESTGPTFDRSIRRKIMVRLGDDYEEKTEMIGSVRKLDTQGQSFSLMTDKRESVRCDFSKELGPEIATALKQYRSLNLKLEGTAVFAPDGTIRRVQDIERIELIDKGPDIEARIEMLSRIEDGWLEGGGIRIEEKLLNEVARVLRDAIEKYNVRPPHLFPTPEGGLQAEWRLSQWDIEMEYRADREILVMAESKPDEEWEDRTFTLDRENLPSHIAKFVNDRDRD